MARAPLPAASLTGDTADSTPPATDDGRRHSMPLDFLLANLWSNTTSVASSARSGHAATGETTREGTTSAHRAAALRRLNGPPKLRHRQSKSVGAPKSSSSQPVIVRTYSKADTMESRRNVPAIREEEEADDVSLPPLDAFSFNGIMGAIEPDIAGTLDAIASICAKSRYSLSNQYEVHMPPHGDNDLVPAHAGDFTLEADGPRHDPLEVASIHSRDRSTTRAIDHPVNVGSTRDPDLPHLATRGRSPTQGISRRHANGLGMTVSRDASKELNSVTGTVSPPALSPLRFSREGSVGPAVSTQEDGHSSRREAVDEAVPHPRVTGSLFSGFSAGADGQGMGSAVPAGHTAANLSPPPAPLVLSDVQLIVSSVDIPRRHGSRRFDHGVSGPAQDGQPRAELRRWSSIGNLAAWLPWFGGENAEPPVPIRRLPVHPPVGSGETAENSLRGLLRCERDD
ncbi:MAG: hypothetical protein M1838_004733 [Thelocarpon superellum]|nr:MAG: hypothetical protein M1838_004733 [Thelocarpon superellum]